MSGEIAEIRRCAPCSVELPAGCGKTQLIASLVRHAAADHKHSLVLTHTHAGVDALRKRCRGLNVPSGAYTVRTIDSWCFELISKFPLIADIEAPDEPDWQDSSAYHVAGERAVTSDAVARMLVASYEQVIVDEYQDCSVRQHDLVVAISKHVDVVVLGDRMQGLFFFDRANPPVDWEADVLPAFPEVRVAIKPWRWRATNPNLGEWLIDARSRLLDGRGVTLQDAPVARVASASLVRTCLDQPSHPDRVAVLAKWPKDCAVLARRLSGSYSMIEEMEGRFLLKFADEFDAGDAPSRAAATLRFAVESAFGVAEPFNAAARDRLQNGKALTAPRFVAVATQRDAVNAVLADPSVSAVRSALASLQGLEGFRLFRREAWYGMGDALRLVEVDEELTLREAVVQTRNHLRVIGRYPDSRILARPLLVKGLEFDHVVVADPESYNAHELYVCLTRGSRAVTLATRQNSLAPSRPSRDD